MLTKYFKLLCKRLYVIYHLDLKMGSTPLMHAARRGHVKCIKCLIKQGANVSQRDKVPFMIYIIFILEILYLIYRKARLLLYMLLGRVVNSVLII